MHTYTLAALETADKNINIFKSDGTCPAHTHEFAELVYVYKGTCTHYIDGKAFDLRAGDLLLVNYGQVHRTEDKTGAKFYNIEYIPAFFGRELTASENLYDIFEYLLLDDGSNGKMLPVEKISFSEEEQRVVKNILDEMYTELGAKRPGYRNILHGYSRVLFSMILRKTLKAKMPDDTSVHRIVEQCIRYIDQNYFQKLTLEELAKQTAYNPSYLSRIFKKYGGRNLWDYLKEKRVEEAARLLTETEDTVEKTAEKVGYTDKSKFHKDFKAVYGVTPAEYRKK